MSTPIDKLNNPKECLELLELMKPKGEYNRESVEKLQGLLRLYEKTIEVLELTRVDAECAGDKIAYGMTISQIDNALAERLSEKMLMEEIIALELSDNVSSNFIEARCKECGNVNQLTKYAYNSSCRKCLSLLFPMEYSKHSAAIGAEKGKQKVEQNLSEEMESLNISDFTDINQNSNMYVDVACGKCGMPNRIKTHKGNGRCVQCSSLVFPSDVAKDTENNTMALSEKKVWSFNDFQPNASPALAPVPEQIVVPAIIRNGSSPFLDKEPIVMSVVDSDYYYENWSPLHEKYRDLSSRQRFHLPLFVVV